MSQCPITCDIMSDQREFTCEQMAEAIEHCGGILTDTARLLGCNRKTVSRYVHDYYPDELEPVVEQFEASLVDEAKKTILKAVEDGDWRAAKYVLNSRAGWTEKREVDVTSDGERLGGAVLILPDNGRGLDDDE